jgi:hypothetical protein
MVGIARARLEGEMLVKSHGVVVLGVYEQRAGPNRIRSLRRTQQRILEQRGANPLSLQGDIDGETREKDHRDRMARHALLYTLSRLVMANGTCRASVQ